MRRERERERERQRERDRERVCECVSLCMCCATHRKQYKHTDRHTHSTHTHTHTHTPCTTRTRTHTHTHKQQNHTLVFRSICAFRDGVLTFHAEDNKKKKSLKLVGGVFREDSSTRVRGKLELIQREIAVLKRVCVCECE